MEKYLYSALTVIGGLLALFMYVNMYQELVIVAQVILFLVALAGSAFLLAFMAVTLTKGMVYVNRNFEELKRERLRTEEARIEVKNKAFSGSIVFNTAPAGHQVFAAHLPDGTVIDPLHLAPGRVNGVAPGWELDGPTRHAAYHAAYASRTVDPALLAPPAPLALPAPDLPHRVALADYAARPSLKEIFLGIGRWADGSIQPVTADLESLVHIAIGGASGFGKSTMILSLAYQILYATEGARPVMLDGGNVTFTYFKGDSRLFYPVAGNAPDIEGTLEALTGELIRRETLYGGFKGIDSLTRYNRIAPDPLPMIPILFDEFSLVGDNKHIAGFAAEISRRGRKVGMPLIASCQTWLAQEIGSAIRANLSTAIQLHVRYPSQSRLLLGSSDATRLKRPGQAYAALPGQPGLIELQTPDPSDLLNHLVGQPVEIEATEIPQPSRPDTPTPWDKDMVIDMKLAGKSYVDICRAHGKGQGGKQNQEIKAILEEAGIEV